MADIHVPSKVQNYTWILNDKRAAFFCLHFTIGPTHIYFFLFHDLDCGYIYMYEWIYADIIHKCSVHLLYMKITEYLKEIKQFVMVVPFCTSSFKQITTFNLILSAPIIW